MGTLKTEIDRARKRIDEREKKYSNAEMIEVANSVIDEIYHFLVRVKSSLASSEPSDLTNYDTDDLPYDGVFDNYIMWRLKADMLDALERDSARATAKAQIVWDTAIKIIYTQGIQVNSLIDEIYQFLVRVKSSFASSEPSGTTIYDTDDLPYNGIFDEYIAWRLQAYMLEALGQDNTDSKNRAQIVWDTAIKIIYTQGIQVNSLIDEIYQFLVRVKSSFASSEPSGTTIYDTDDLPYDGIFDEYIAWRVKSDMFESLGQDNTDSKNRAQIVWDTAIKIIYTQGIQVNSLIDEIYQFLVKVKSSFASSEPSGTTIYDTDDLPYNGIFDEYIAWRVKSDMFESLGQDNTDSKNRAQIVWDTAIKIIYTRGIQVNSILDEIHQILVNIKSNLVFTTETVVTSTIVNGEFENWTNSSPDNVTASSDVTLEEETASPYSGSSLKITAAGANQSARFDAVTVSEASDYTLKLRYKNTAGDVAQYQVYDITNGADIKAITDLDDSTTWSAEQSISFTTPSGCTSIYVYLLAKTSGDIVWFDNVYLNTTTDGNGAYTLSTDFYTPMPKSAWINDYVGCLPQIEESERWTKYGFDDTTTGTPECFFITRAGNIAYRPIPNAEFTIYHPVSVKPGSSIIYDTDDLPYDGIFDNYIMWRVKADMFEALRQDSADSKNRARVAWDIAFGLVCGRGIQSNSNTDMFDHPDV